MKTIKVLKKALVEIAQLLALNERLQRLLVNDVEEPLSGVFTPLTINELIEKEYINTSGFLENGIEHNGRNTFLVLQWDEFHFPDNEKVNGTGSIFIGTDYNHVLLNKNQNRLLEIVDEVIMTLDSQKISSAGTINISYATMTVYSEMTFGYRITFTISDQMTKKAEL